MKIASGTLDELVTRRPELPQAEQPPRIPAHRWEPLSKIVPDDFASPQLRKKIAAVNQPIRELLNNRAKADESIDNINAESIADVNFDNLTGLPTIRMHRIMLLQKEFTLREQIDSLFAEIIEEIRIQGEKALAKLNDTRASIRTGLVKFGYIDTLDTNIQPGKITPGMIEGHPSVIAARQTAESLSARLSSHDASHENRAAMERLENHLVKVRASAATS